MVHVLPFLVPLMHREWPCDLPTSISALEEPSQRSRTDYNNVHAPHAYSHLRPSRRAFRHLFPCRGSTLRLSAVLPAKFRGCLRYERGA